MASRIKNFKMYRVSYLKKKTWGLLPDKTESRDKIFDTLKSAILNSYHLYTILLKMTDSKQNGSRKAISVTAGVMYCIKFWILLHSHRKIIFYLCSWSSIFNSSLMFSSSFSISHFTSTILSIFSISLSSSFICESFCLDISFNL